VNAETIGQRLRRLRLARGISQRELATKGVSYAYISRIEAGARRPSVKALRQLAEKLGVTESYLEGSGANWTDVVRDALFFRISDDPGYARRRLGADPDERQVWAIVNEIAPRVADELAQALDPFESQVWDRLVAAAHWEEWQKAVRADRTTLGLEEWIEATQRAEGERLADEDVKEAQRRGF
jgi:transcriptional regulator with XRE-family HTH domain